MLTSTLQIWWFINVVYLGFLGLYKPFKIYAFTYQYVKFSSDTPLLKVLSLVKTLQFLTIDSCNFVNCCSLKLQILDVAVSLAKVADVDRSLGNEEVAVNGFQEAITLLETLKLKSEDAGLEQRVRIPCFD